MVNYIPILTTFLSVVFLIQIGQHYLQKPKAHYLLWWTIGIFTYGLGTLTESIHALAGWSETNTKLWYIAGALLGGYPLAQGSVYLLIKKRTADLLMISGVMVIITASVCVVLSPLIIPDGFDYRLTGKVFAWKWVRNFSPFLNIYSFVFLFGGAVYSAMLYYRSGKTHARFLGNIFIAVGSLLPGIGGTFTRFGYVEVLFVTELIGLSLIYAGYIIMKKDSEVTVHQNQIAVS